MVMSSRGRKAKGSRLQKLVAADLSSISGIPWGKDEMIASRESAQTGNDIRLVGGARTLFNVAIECKSQEKWGLNEYIEQSKNNLDGMDYWCVIAKKKNKKPYVFTSQDYLMWLSPFFLTEVYPSHEGKNWVFNKWAKDLDGLTEAFSFTRNGIEDPVFCIKYATWLDLVKININSRDLLKKILETI